MPTLFIDQNIIKNNIDITKKLAGDSQVIGVIKENGYGLGLCPYAHLLVENGIEMLAVTELSEAVALRRDGIHCDILLLSPLYKEEDIKTALRHFLILCITSGECGEAAEQAATELSLYARAHLCIDTGLGRYGFPDTRIKDILYTVNYMKHICITGIYSHFYASACKKIHHTKEQFERFTSLCNALERENVFIGFRHIAATCALLRFPETRLDAVRIGSAFLGRLPMKDEWGYQPVGQLEAPVSDIHTLPAGHNIGYGNTYVTARTTTVAVVSAGYSHGLGIRRSSNCPGIIHLPRFIYHEVRRSLFPDRLFAYRMEETFPVLGKVGMNSVIIDITGKTLSPGDIVRLPVNPIYVDSSVPRSY
ncbi:MAG: alanine racemase [Bacteroidales bacterium]|nr:alanine racemase [Clostridium sp.]MCM1204318.1 alanine racemase [Bacteroidales bacterium]